MNRFISAGLILSVSSALLWGADVNVVPSAYQKDETRITAFDNYLRKTRHFRAQSREDLEKNLRDDWLLANHFIEKAYTPMEKAEIVNLVNRVLAQKEIERIQKKIGIKDDVVKSYYLDHLSEYRLKPMVSIKIFHFASLRQADDFYRFALKHTYAQSTEKLKKDGIKAVDYTHPLNMMQPVYRLSLRNLEDQHYFTPPQFVGKGFAVVYVDTIKKRDRYAPFDKVKKSIAKMLWQKTYLEKRAEILASYQDKQ